MTEGLYPPAHLYNPPPPFGQSPLCTRGPISKAPCLCQTGVGMAIGHPHGAFPVQGKVVPQEPDEVSILFFLIWKDIVSFGQIE